MRILIVGTGTIAPEYIRALRALGETDISVIGRNEDKAAQFGRDHGIANAWGGGEGRLSNVAGKFDAIILAASIPALLPLLRVCREVAPNARLLVEKPAALSSHELGDHLAGRPDRETAVALNRRYFPSICMLRTRLQNETIRSVAFSFTEWVHRIDTAAYTPDVLSAWGIANCVHVIDTVFDLMGLPTVLNPTIGGRNDLPWHPSGSIFTGSGIAGLGIPFSYHSDFCSAGRWAIQVHTDRGRYDLMPMENLTFIPRGSVTPEALFALPVGGTKCGFEPMLGNWLGHIDNQPLPTLDQIKPVLELSEQIFGYRSDPAE